MSCNDLCTAAKCAELEARIEVLEETIYELESLVQLHINQDIPQAHNYEGNNDLALLEAAFNAHVAQEIPEAHLYQPNLDLSLDFADNALLATLNIDDVVVDDFVDLSDLLISSFGININEVDSNLYEFEITINDSVDTTQFSFAEPELTLEIDELYPGEFGASLTVGTVQTQDNFTVTFPDEFQQNQQSNVQVQLDHSNDVLTVFVSDGITNDSDSIFLEVNNINNFGGGEVSCEGISQELTDCCSAILSAIANAQNIIVAEVEDSENNISNKIDAAIQPIENSLLTIESDIDRVENYVTVDITGELNTTYQCEFATDDNDQIIPAYAESKFKTTDLSTQQLKGLAGIHEYLKIIAVNLDSIHADVCKSIDPISDIKYSDLYRFCNNSNINRSDYSDTEEGETEYIEAINQYLESLLLESKYNYLITGRDENSSDTLLEAPNNWITPILADFSLIQSRINNNAICDLEISGETDVVSIVASDRFVRKVTGKVLILHFVTFDNYPKRVNSSGYRPVQIPAALEEYDWLANFEDLRWQQGNLFGELRFVEPYVPVSGWFASKEAANVYFDKILTLTNATEDNRVFPDHSNPKTAIPMRQTRPYRAFIKSVNELGQGVCHAVYKPLEENGN